MSSLFQTYLSLVLRIAVVNMLLVTILSSAKPTDTYIQPVTNAESMDQEAKESESPEASVDVSIHQEAQQDLNTPLTLPVGSSPIRVDHVYGSLIDPGDPQARAPPITTYIRLLIPAEEVIAKKPLPLESLTVLSTETKGPGAGYVWIYSVRAPCMLCSWAGCPSGCRMDHGGQCWSSTCMNCPC